MRWSAACTSAALAISSERGTLSVIYRSYGVSGPDDGADAVAEGLEPVERVVDGAGGERQHPAHGEGEVELAPLDEAHELGDLGGEVVGHADDLRLPVQDVAVGRDGDPLLRQAGERRASLRREHRDRLLHRAREADQLECRVDAAAAGRIADGSDRVAGFRIDRRRAEPGGQRELRGIDVDGVDRAGTERARELYRGNAEAAGAEDGDRLAGREARLA